MAASKTTKPEAPAVSASEALAELRKGLRLFKSFEAAEATLVVLESAEQNLRETRAAVAAAQKELADARAECDREITRLKAKMADHKAAADAAERSASGAGASIIASAESDAAAMRTQAKDILEKARAQAAELDSKLGDVMGAIEVKKAELRDVEARLARAQEQVKKLLGAGA